MSKKPTYEELELRVRALKKADSERKKIEQKLFEMESYQRALINAVTDTLFLMKPDGTILFANDGLAKKLDMPINELIGKKASELVPTDVEVKRKVALDQMLNSGKPVTLNDTHSGDNIESRFFPIKDTQGKVTHVAIFARDITEQKLNEKKIRQNEARFRALAEMLPGAVCEADLDLNLTFVNQQAYKMFGYSKQDFENGLNCLEMIVPKDRKKAVANYTNRLQGDDFDATEYGALKKDGTVFPILMHASTIYDNGNAMGLRAILIDITDQKKMESLLIESQKMEALGTLAGGIAHDFNNILSLIMLHAELAIEDLSQGDPLKLNMKEIYRAGERARDLVKQILTFARKSSDNIIVLKSSSIVEEAIKFLRSTIPTTIDIRYNDKAERDTIQANPTQLNQIIMNLCTNAAHAVRDKGGLLEIILDNHHISESKADLYGNLKPGKYLKLTVADNGKGISPDIIDKIFDPYYTTKKVGEGTGLGLAIVHGIVQNYGGYTTVESKIGQGTTFHVYLPLIEGRNTIDDDQRATIQKGTERILFVDDEKPAVDASQKMLEKLGYKVIAKTSSIEALEAFRNNPASFDLVITDMTMPNMTGKELAKELISINPDIPIILCTGFNDKIDEAKAKKIGIRYFVMKPIAMRELSKKIRELLDTKYGK